MTFNLAKHGRNSSVRRTAVIISMTAAALIVLLILWVAHRAFLLIFAGILFGALLDACVRGLRLIVPLGRAWLLAITCVVLVAFVALLILWGGVSLVQEFDYLRRVLNEQVTNLRERAVDLGILLDENGKDGAGLSGFLSGHAGAILGPATTAVSTALGAMVNATIIAVAGIFVAADPGFYRDALVRFVPVDKRARVSETLDEMGVVLRWWLLGQLVAMVLIGVSVAVALSLLGVPGALLLALQAALLSFIPYLGPLLAGIPIALAAIPMGMFLLAMTLLAYAVIQTVEGYLLTPLIHKQAVDLPPLLTLGALLVMGSLFGVGGIILSTPLIAIGRIAVLRLYFEDWLEKDSLRDVDRR
jgi:predicted PurR-regulated permease PerM